MQRLLIPFFASLVISFIAPLALGEEDHAAAVAKANAQDKKNTGPLDNQPKRLVWLQDNGFGMFINFSVDNILGNVISHNLVGASEDYSRRYHSELPKLFNPKKWDPEYMVRLAKTTGMKYIVLDVKHHNGFCMWDTKTTDFNVMHTPYKRDILKDYLEAGRKVGGVELGIYYSPEDWWWLKENGFEVRRRPPPADPDSSKTPKYTKYVEDQLHELFTKYGPVKVLFIDGCGQRVTRETTWKLQPECLITRGAMSSPEQYIPGRAPKGVWESNLTMGTQWQYKPQVDDNYKSPMRLIEMLIETRAKGGALLLNIAPKPDGSLPEEVEQRLHIMGLWNFINQECIFNVRPWVVTREQNIWFTREKNNKAIYAIVTGIHDWRRGTRKEFLLRSVRATDKTRVGVLGQNDKIVEYTNIKPDSRFEQTEKGLKVSVVRAQRIYNNYGWPYPIVIKLENVEPALKEAPSVDTGVARQTGPGTIAVTGELLALGETKKVTVGVEYQVYGGFVDNSLNTDWTKSETAEMNTKGTFSTTIKGLTPAAVYQYRTFVDNGQIIMRGDNRRVTVK